MTGIAFGGDKKFNVCLESGEATSLAKYGPLEIFAYCDIAEMQVFFSSSDPNTKTTDGFYSDPFLLEMFVRTSSGCDNDIDDGAMISENGFYLGIDGEMLILCRNEMDCDCSASGIVIKQKIKQKTKLMPPPDFAN